MRKCCAITIERAFSHSDARVIAAPRVEAVYEWCDGLTAKVSEKMGPALKCCGLAIWCNRGDVYGFLIVSARCDTKGKDVSEAQPFFAKS